MFYASKKFKMETAHVLDSSYMKCCQQIHGHSVVVEVSISAEELNEDGMVMDFKLLKEICGVAFVDEMDHAFLMSQRTTNILISKYGHHVVSEVYPGLVVVPYNPTAENIAKDIYDRLSGSFPRGVNLEEVMYWETESASVSYWRDM